MCLLFIFLINALAKLFCSKCNLKFTKNSHLCTVILLWGCPTDRQQILTKRASLMTLITLKQVSGMCRSSPWPSQMKKQQQEICQGFISLYRPKNIFLKPEEYFENVYFPNGRNRGMKTYFFKKNHVSLVFHEQWDLVPV